MPFGALRKAQRALAQASAVDHSDDDENLIGGEDEEEVDDDSAPEETSWGAGLEGKEREQSDAGKPKEIPKRKHKHA